MTGVAVYVRVSSKDQNPESQRAELERWLALNGYSDVRWFEDKETGETLKRPAFQKLRRAVFEGRVTTVIVWKLDRLARSLLDGMRILIEWLERDVRIISTTQQLDLAGVVGQMIAAVLFAMAEIELKNIRERQAAGIRTAKAKGVYKGRQQGSFKGDVERAKQLRAMNIKPPEIAKLMGLNRSTVYRYLQRK